MYHLLFVSSIFIWAILSIYFLTFGVGTINVKGRWSTICLLDTLIGWINHTMSTPSQNKKLHHQASIYLASITCVLDYIIKMVILIDTNMSNCQQV